MSTDLWRLNILLDDLVENTMVAAVKEIVT